MSEKFVVTDPTGLTGTVLESSDSTLLVQLPGGRNVRVPKEFLRSSGNDYVSRVGFDEMEKAETLEMAIPVIEEKLELGTRKTEETVRITKDVQHEEVVLDVPEVHQEVKVERVPINRVVEAEVMTRVEGDTTIIPVLEEQVIIEKRLVLREEIHITKTQSTQHRKSKIRLRKESVRSDPQ